MPKKMRRCARVVAEKWQRRFVGGSRSGRRRCILMTSGRRRQRAAIAAAAAAFAQKAARHAAAVAQRLRFGARRIGELAKRAHCKLAIGC